MKTVILLDTDIVAYKLVAATEESFDFGDTGVCEYVEDLRYVCKKADEVIAKLVARLKADELIVCLSVPTAEGFRRNVLPTYKSNRTGKKSDQLQPLKDYLAKEYRSYTKPTLEADDVMGILATHPDLIKGKKIIVSEDKDMKTIPCWLFNPRKDTGIQHITQYQADRLHMVQTLMGDAVDGYKGCPDIGIVKAEKALDGADSADFWNIVVDLYKSKGLTEEDALVQAQVARILRHTDYDFKKGEVKLWTPSR